MSKLPGILKRNFAMFAKVAEKLRVQSPTGGPNELRNGGSLRCKVLGVILAAGSNPTCRRTRDG